MRRGGKDPKERKEIASAWAWGKKRISRRKRSNRQGGVVVVPGVKGGGEDLSLNFC